MARNTRTVNHNYMNLNCHERKMKCIVNMVTDQLLMSSTNLDDLLKTYEALELDSKEFLVMDYEAYLNIDDSFFDVHPHVDLPIIHLVH